MIWYRNSECYDRQDSDSKHKTKTDFEDVKAD